MMEVAVAAVKLFLLTERKFVAPLWKMLGIIPNSDKHGDFKGIELKTHTQKSLYLRLNLIWAYTIKTLKILCQYGYQDGNENIGYLNT